MEKVQAVDKIQAEDNLRLIRDIMERSTKYTHFSGLSGIIAGVLALIGCYISAMIWVSLPDRFVAQSIWYFVTWVSILVLALAQDLALAQRKAKRMGQTIWVPATYQAMKALLPGVFIGFVLSLQALLDNAYDYIPIFWILGYGASLVAAGMFSIKELRVFGWVQLFTGATALLIVDYLPHYLLGRFSLGLVALAFGIYHIIYGIVMTRKYGW